MGIVETKVGSEILNLTKKEVSYLCDMGLITFVNEDGLFNPNRVNLEEYNYTYYSKKNRAYPEGYDIGGRCEKYEDVITNIKDHSIPPVIDLGCGPGPIVTALHEKKVDIQGVDISCDAINFLSLQSVRSLLKTGSLTNLPYNDSEFNSGVSFHVLEHLTKYELEKALSEISRVIKNQLYLIIPVLDKLDNFRLFKQIVSDPTHRTIATHRWWIEQFNTFGGWNYNNEMAKGFDRLKRGWVFVFER